MIFLRLWSLFLIAVCCSRGLFAAAYTTDGGIKTRYEIHADNASAESQYPAFHRAQILPWLRLNWGQLYTVKGRLRGYVNFPQHNNEVTRAGLEADELWIAAKRERWKATIGMQHIAWGENFGLNPADVVNPRNFDEPATADFSEAKLPVGMLNVQWFWGDFDAQGVFVPLPRTAPRTTRYSWFYNGEGGVRLGHRFGNVNANAFYYRHWNRVPVPGLESFDGVWVPVLLNTFRVQTFGGSANATFGDWVFRGDVVGASGEPLFIDFFSDHLRSNVVYTVAGTDRSFSAWGDLGLQYMGQHWLGEVPFGKTPVSHFVGLNAQGNFGAGRFEPQLLAMSGINTSAMWLRARLRANLSDALTLGVESNVVRTDPKSVRPIFSQNKRSVMGFAELAF